jgi:hypothetical protein
MDSAGFQKWRKVRWTFGGWTNSQSWKPNAEPKGMRWRAWIGGPTVHPMKELYKMKLHRASQRCGLINSILKIVWLDTKERLLHDPHNCWPVLNDVLKLGEKSQWYHYNNKGWTRYIRRVDVLQRTKVHMPSSQDISKKGRREGSKCTESNRRFRGIETTTELHQPWAINAKGDGSNSGLSFPEMILRWIGSDASTKYQWVSGSQLHSVLHDW